MQPVAIITADKEVIELVKQLQAYQLIGFFDKNSQIQIQGLENLGDDSAWLKIKSTIPNLKVIVSVDPTTLKEKLVNLYGLDSIVSAYANDTYISPTAKIDNGCILQTGVKIFADAHIGKCCKINVNATVHHDNKVGDYCTLAPGCQLLGYVSVGNRVFIGAGAIILPYCKIGDDVTIGAGAVVTRDVPTATTVAGIPAKVITKSSAALIG